MSTLRTLVLRALPYLFAVAFLYVLLAGDASIRTDIFPGDDPNRDFPWVFQMLETHRPVLFGGQAAYGFGLPSPFFLWLITIGYVIGGYVGSWILFVFTYVAAAGVATTAISKATGSRLAGYGLVAALVVQDRFYTHGSNMFGMTPTWLNSTILANVCLLAAVAASLATPKRWKWSAPVAVIMSAVSVAIWPATAVLALVPFITGVVAFVRHRLTFTRFQRDLTIGVPVFIIALFLARWAQYGAGFLADYVRAITSLHGYTRLPENTLPFDEILGQITFGLPFTTAVYIWITLAVAGTIAAVRRIPGALPFLAVGGAAIITGTQFVPRQEPHIASVMSVFTLLAAAVAIGALGRFAGRYAPGIVSVALVVAVAVPSLIGLSNSGHMIQRFANAIQYRPSVAELIETFRSDPVIGPALAAGEVAVVVDGSDYEVRLKLLGPAIAEMNRQGAGICFFVATGDTPPGHGGSNSDLSRCKPNDLFRYALMSDTFATQNGHRPLVTIEQRIEPSSPNPSRIVFAPVIHAEPGRHGFAGLAPAPVDTTR